MGELLNYRVRRLYIDRPNPSFRARPWTRLLNWGNSRAPVGFADSIPVSNSFAAVAVASNKLSTFQALENKDEIRIPDWTTDMGVAREWISSGLTVLCRRTLSGHSGAGIVLASLSDDLVAAPLYVKYIKKSKEFRIHVAFGEVIDVQEKRKRRDLPEEFQTNFQVRNHHTGWVYCREDLQLPDDATGMAIKACQELGLDFGAVDIIYNAKRDMSYVLEINTAPGLEGQTVNNYATAFVKALS
jgi:glutathione synthase/RimK-type ligase-like ATP-grasp enzyme